MLAADMILHCGNHEKLIETPVWETREIHVASVAKLIRRGS